MRVSEHRYWNRSYETLLPVCVLHAKSLQLCPTLCNPMDCSPPGSSIHGDSVQARILQWVAMPSSMGSSQSRDQTHVSYVSCIGKWVLYHYHHLGIPSFPAELNKISMALPSLIAMWFGWLWGRVLQEHKHMAGSTKMSVTISWKTQCKKILLLKKAVLTNNVQGTLHFS